MIHHPIWALGFRPFFLLGSLAAVTLVSSWAIFYFNENLPTGYFDPIYWHAHEMIYGFTVAIIAGFLLTASANWTKTKALSGKKLFILFVLWLAGRLAFGLSIFDLGISYWLYFFTDILFLPALVLALSSSLLKARQLKNTQFLLVLSLLGIGNLLMHLSALEVIEFDYASKGIYLGVNLVLLIIITIGGRVVPFFTSSALAEAKIHKYELIEYATFLSVACYIFLDFFGSNETLTGWVALVTAAINFVRFLTWKPWRTIKHPLLWILHLGYMWIVVGFFLVYFSDVLALLPRSVAIHSFTAGAMGTFIIGMMSRVSLGHTGRALKLPKGFILSYFLITLSALIRVGSGFFPEIYSTGILLSGICWALSFVLFLSYYSFILLSPRPDGRAG